MFTVYIDDSGTAPDQHVAIATALIIPSARLAALEREWDNLRKKENFSSFHTSECVALNPNSEFADWDELKQRRVISRVRQIGKKFASSAFSIAVKKSDYDDVIPANMRKLTGEYHYTWAIRNLISFLAKWAKNNGVTVPLEYVYDRMDPRAQKDAKAEIDSVMAQAEHMASEAGDAGRYVNYSFRRRQDIPALQCTDSVAWTCYRFALFAFNSTPLLDIAHESWKDYYQDDKGWLMAAAMTKKQLQDWLVKEQADGRWVGRLADWESKHPSKKKARKAIN
jgi:hypothetical protein